MKKLVWAVLCALLALGLAACTISVTPAGAGQQKVPGIGLALASPDSAWGAALTEYARAAAEELSLPLYAAEAAADAAGQAAQLEGLMDQGARVLVVEAVEAEALADALARAKAAGIPVVSLERPLEGAVCHIGSDLEQSGAQAARYLADALGEGGRAAALEGNADIGAGFFSIAHIRLDVSARRTLEEGVLEAREAMMALLEADPTIQGVFAADSSLAQGALEAAGEKGGDIVVVGCGASYEVLKALQEGRMDAALVPQPERLAGVFVETAAALLKDQIVSSLIPVEMALVTGANAQEYMDFVEIPDYAIPCQVGLALSNGSDPFQAALRRSAEEAAARLDISLAVRDAGGDAAAQAAGLEELLVKKAQVLLLAPVEGGDLTELLAAAREDGVRVVTLEQPVENSDCRIFVDDRLGGQLAAQFLLDSSEEGLRVAMLGGGDTAQWEGFHSAAEDGLNIIAREDAGFDRDQARTVMLTLLEAEEKPEAVFAAGDAMALGALDALEELKISLPVIGYGGSGQALTAVEVGWLAATVSRQPERMGSAAMEAAAKFLNGEEAEAEISVEPSLIIREAREPEQEIQAAAETTAETTAEAITETTEETAAETTEAAE